VRNRHIVARTKQIAVAAKELLSMPAPDTFVGRKTHEPFPKEMTLTRPQPQAEAAFDHAIAPAKDHVMSKRENDANNIFRPSDSPLTEYEKEQIALRRNLERLKAERLAREAANSKND
jgi:hypothetical protein